MRWVNKYEMEYLQVWRVLWGVGVRLVLALMLDLLGMMEVLIWVVMELVSELLQGVRGQLGGLSQLLEQLRGQLLLALIIWSAIDAAAVGLPCVCLSLLVCIQARDSEALQPSPRRSS